MLIAAGGVMAEMGKIPFGLSDQAFVPLLLLLMISWLALFVPWVRRAALPQIFEDDRRKGRQNDLFD